MRQRIRAAMRDESGFTLIELLITVVILGVLAGVVVFAVGAFNSDGVQAACKSDIKNVEVAAEAYKAKTGNYAASVTVLKDAGYLKSVPPTAASRKYTVTYVPADGTATGTFGTAANDCLTYVAP